MALEKPRRYLEAYRLGQGFDSPSGSAHESNRMDRRCRPVLLPESALPHEETSDPRSYGALSPMGGRSSAGQPRNALHCPPHRLKFQVRVLLVHVLARMAGQFLADLKWYMCVGHCRIEVPKGPK
jgi:hypothetical protein